MKQHITIKQWDEITHEQKNKLDNFGCKNDWRMNIGQMIEFLTHNNKDEMVFTVGGVGEVDGKVFEEECRVYEYYNWYDGYGNVLAEADELCDALWKVVKHELNK